jgi:formamidopyrimidine-DNA glycosylase
VPELPDISAYQVALERLVVGRLLNRVILRSPFLLRSVEPDLFCVEGQTIQSIRRLGKRIVFELDGQLCLVFHLMIAGRFHWRKVDSRPRGKTELAAFQFDNGTLMLTEASPKKRAALYVVAGVDALSDHDPGGLEVLSCTEREFRQTLLSENHTLKRSLTDPRLFSGIGNAYSDEILHAARLSPLTWTSRLSDGEVSRLFAAVRTILKSWTDQLITAAASEFPERVTAFREGMAVHGRFGEPCPDCGTSVQRIVHAENEINYCPKCQTGSKLLADRSLSRLLKDDWPKTIEELEQP